MTLSVNNGSLTLHGTANLTFTTGDGTSDATMTFTALPAALNSAMDGVRYKPAADYSGTDNLSVSTSDQGNTGAGGVLTDTDIIPITVTGINDSPIVGSVAAANVFDADTGATAYDFTVTFTDDSAINVSTLDNGDVYVITPGAGTIAATFISVDTPGDGTPRTATYRIVPPGGSWDVTDNGTYTIGIYGSQVADADVAYIAANANIGTFSVTIVNEVPVITEGSGPLSRTIDEDNNPISFGLTLNATDADDDTLTWSILTPAAHGTATVATGTGTSQIINYTPAPDYNTAAGGAESFVVQVSDGNGGTDTITVNVTVNTRNDAPINTVPGPQTVDEDTDLVFSSGTGNAIAIADIDVDEAAVPNNTVQVSLTVSHGTLTLHQVDRFNFFCGRWKCRCDYDLQGKAHLSQSGVGRGTISRRYRLFRTGPSDHHDK